MKQIIFTNEQIQLAKNMAKQAEIGGVSWVRDKVSRDINLKDDQLVGQLGELAASVYLTGSIDCYIQHRTERNKNPYTGDDGTDIMEYDVKTSLMRYGQDPTKYNLLVRPRERGKNKKYLPVFISKDMMTAYIMNAVSDEELEEKGITDKRFGNAKCLNMGP